MGKPRPILWAAALLLAAAVSLRVCRPAPVPEPRTVEIPSLPTPPVEKRPPQRAEPALPRPPDPLRLRPFLERLGRARLLRDRRSIDALRGQLPVVYESDAAWIFSNLEGELFVAAGAAEFARLFGFHDAVPRLASALSRPGHPFLKDVVIEALASLGGDAAEAAVLEALRSDTDDSIRVRCAAALPAFGATEACQALIAALRDPSARVRSAAAGALARMNSKAAVDMLLGAFRDERDPTAQADLLVSVYAIQGEAARDAIQLALQDRPAVAELLRSRTRLRGDARYQRSYDRAFFELGGPPVPFDASKRRIGVTLELGAGVTPQEVGTALFGVAPLDRYRAWFYFRKADDFPAPKAYDSHGNAMEDIPYGELDGTVFLHFKDPASFAKGVLGYSKGCNAYVQGASLLHEFGHAFARLGDEYADGSREDAVNLFRKQAVPWAPFVGTGLLPPPLRRDAEFLMPSENCFLNNSAAQSRYCPVCQLEIHERIAELTGAPLPW